MPTIAPGSPVSTECPPRSKHYSKCFTCFPPIILPISPGVRSHHYPHFIIGKTKTQRAHITSKHSHWDLNPGVWFQSLYFKDHLTICKMEGRGWPSTNRGRARNPLCYPYPLPTCYQSHSTVSPSVARIPGILTPLSLHQYPSINICH